jgi:hypothetical protein
MSADAKSPDQGNGPLQFDVAESAAPSNTSRPSSTCRGCSRPITGEYYQVNGSIVCTPCRASLERPAGARWQRILRAASLGTLAAIGGSLLYFAVAAITGREFGLVAIVVGYMVGMAVRKGSRGRGGWAYQSLAIGLTYLAIVTSYVPLIAREFQKSALAHSSRSTNAVPMADTITISARGPDVGRAVDSAAAERRADSGFTVMQSGAPTGVAQPIHAHRGHLDFGTLLLGVGTLVLMAAMIPILAGFSNIIGIVIIGIAVFEAWKLNRRIKVTITGPYRVANGTSVMRAVG